MGNQIASFFTLFILSFLGVLVLLLMLIGGIIFIKFKLLKKIFQKTTNNSSNEKETPPTQPEKEKTISYQKTKLLSNAELSFFHVLKTATENKYVIAPKVRLADIIEAPKSSKEWKSAFNRICSKHVDFVLCEPDTINTVCVIELDDNSHGKKDRAERDAFVNEALKTAGIPIVHFPAQASYKIEDIKNSLNINS